jgi:DNA ligase (NAD+)
MADEVVRHRIDQLRETIERWNYEYYVLDQPSVIDDEYDAAFKELRDLEVERPELVTPDSPTQRAGAKADTPFGKIEHPVPMLSLSNVYNDEELRAWKTRAERFAGGSELTFVVEPKIDGLAVAVTYTGGRFTRGATRGDGFVGEDISANLRTVRSIPLSLRGEAPPELEVRGEIYLAKHDFEQLNERMLADGGTAFMNPRNAAAGSLRQLDARITRSRPLRLITYGIGYVNGAPAPTTHYDGLELMRSLGFAASPAAERCATIEEVWAVCERWLERRNDFEFEIDGVVVKVDDVRLQEEIGYVAREPRWATAYKFPAIQKVTTLTDIVINVGRTGTLNPLAHLEPVNIGGVLVQRATLHNEDEIARKDLRIGDTVIVQRAGDVIPQIVMALTDRRTGNEIPFVMPDHCPVCGAPTVREEGEAMRYCTNSACPAQLKEHLHHFVSRTAMDIEGMGSKLTDRFIDLGWIGDVADVYRLDWNAVAQLEGLGEKSAANLALSTEASKARPLARIVNALGIRHVGERTAQLLVDRFGSIDAMMSASESDINDIAGIGTVVAASIHSFFAAERNRMVIEKLRVAGVRMAEDRVERAGGIDLKGMTIVLTGRFERFNRSQAEEMLRQAGANVTGSVSKKTTLVIAGEEAGSKADRARELGVTIADEDELIRLLEGEAPESSRSDGV